MALWSHPIISQSVLFSCTVESLDVALMVALTMAATTNIYSSSVDC